MGTKKSVKRRASFVGVVEDVIVIANVLGVKSLISLSKQHDVS